jgi:hypothetical protein
MENLLLLLWQSAIEADSRVKTLASCLCNLKSLPSTLAQQLYLLNALNNLCNTVDQVPKVGCAQISFRQYDVAAKTASTEH